MDFNRIVEFYEKISATRSRLEIINILSDMFKFCIQNGEIEDVKNVIYLTQSRLVPEYEEFPKFGVAEKMIIESLIKFTGNSAESIKNIINKEGDVGKAVEILLKKRSQKKVKYSLDAFTQNKKKKNDISSKKHLKISYLYDQLIKLSQIQGEGSQDRKINLINGILRLAVPNAAKYVINIILSTLRIGLADKSIMDGLTKAVLGSKDQRNVIEKAYMIYPDLGEIARILIENGLEGIEAVNIHIGRPIQMMLASRIQYTEIQKKLGGDKFGVEYKYDGERIQVHKDKDKINLFSRKLKNITEQYPDVVENVKKYIEADSIVFEGEAVAMDPFFEKMLPFQVLSTRRRKYDIVEKIKEVPVCLFCFDILYHNGVNIMETPMSERRKIMEQIFPKKDTIRLSEQKVVSNTKKMVEFFEEARSDGAEGIMCKSIQPDSYYQAGNRGFLWIKLKGLEGAKMLDTIDVVIIGGSWGKGKRKGYISTYFGAVYNDQTQNFEFLTRIGSGFTENDLEYYTEKLTKLEVKRKPNNVQCRDSPDIWITPKSVIEVMGDELTISNKADAGSTFDNPEGLGLRFPVYQRERKEKDIYQITTTAEIIDLYKHQ